MALCQAPKVSRINRTAPKTAWPMCCIFFSNDSYPLLSCASHHACRFQKIMLKNIFSLKFTNIIVWLADALSSNSLANFEKLVMSWAIHGFFMLWIENHILSFKFWYKSKFFRVKKSSLKRYRKCIRRFKHWFTQEYTLLVKLQEDSYFATKISFRFTAFCTKKSELTYDCVVVINAKKNILTDISKLPLSSFELKKHNWSVIHASWHDGLICLKRFDCISKWIYVLTILSFVHWK